MVVTQAGLNKALSADSLGVSLKITHVAMGGSGYEPDRNVTALKDELVRVAITGGEIVSGNQIHLTAVFAEGLAFIAREIGFFLEDGTLFALESDPTDVLSYKNESTQLIEGFDLVLDTVPPDSISVDVTGDLSLYYASSLAVCANAQINNMRRTIVNHIARVIS